MTDPMVVLGQALSFLDALGVTPYISAFIIMSLGLAALVIVIKSLRGS